MRIFLYCLTLGVLISSCVSNKKSTLLQRGDLHQRSLPMDTVVRTYVPDTFAYKIQPNDILSIRFEAIADDKYNFLKQEPMALPGGQNVGGALLFGELVDEGGDVAFPSIGKVQVSGLTVFQIEQKLQQIANQYLESPVVRVRLLNFRFTILGEVVKEGTVTLNNNKVTMLEAIGQAGGLGDVADRSHIKLIRTKNGATEVQYVNLLDENFINSPFYYIHQNDVLVVPPLKQRPFRKYFGQNLSLIVSTLSLIAITINLTQ
jgi:polysaccharide export outer membrane protein